MLMIIEQNLLVPNGNKRQQLLEMLIERQKLKNMTKVVVEVRKLRKQSLPQELQQLQNSNQNLKDLLENLIM